MQTTTYHCDKCGTLIPEPLSRNIIELASESSGYPGNYKLALYLPSIPIPPDLCHSCIKALVLRLFNAYENTTQDRLPPPES